jgi:type I restriction enzyme S subunit
VVNLPPIDISPDNWDIVQGTLNTYLPHHEVWAFGSRATRKAKKYSDLDIVIVRDTPLDHSLMASLIEHFQESSLPFKVDVVDWAVTDEHFRKVIEAEKVILVART